MNHSKRNALLVVTLALFLQACTATVTKTRRVPVYAARVEMVDGVERTVEVQVGTKVETYQAKELCWKRTAVGAALAPVVIVAHILGGLG